VGTGSAFTTIDSALNVVVPGDTILVESSPTAYDEAITFDDDNITVKAIGSKENTTITQANATVVNFSTMEGCVLEGFTVNLSAASATGKYVIQGANDTANNTANIIKDCDIKYTTSAAASMLGTIYLTDGDWEFINCNFDLNHTNAGAYYLVNVYTLTNSQTVTLTQCKFDVDHSSTAATQTHVISFTGGGTLNIRDSELVADSAVTAAGYVDVIAPSANAATINIYNSYLYAKTTGSGLTYTLSIDGASTVNSYNNVYYSNNADGDQNWAKVTSGDTLNSYGDQIIDGTLSNAGTFKAGLAEAGIVSAEADETKFSHKMAVDIGGVTYYIMLTDS